MQPISARGWTFDELLGKGERFKPATRVSCTSQGLNTRIHEYEDLGVPLVIENWHQESHWPEDIFNMDFCRQHFRDGKKKISARNVHTRLDQVMAFEDFVEKARAVPPFTEPNETERWYGKDVECPRQWEDWLRNECVLPNKLLPEGSSDILACRPRKNGRPDVETLMCYFGIADTYTPCHKDLCASSGQNLMCYTEKGGSSFWFMTKSSDCGKVTSYFHKLKHELDHETHVLSLSELANAPFDIYIVEQKLGDLVLVPPRSCHQVINFGGMTIKMSWSRMTLNGLTVALYHELPLYRRVCRPEIYQIKSTIYHTLRHYTQNLKNTAAQEVTSIQKSVLTNTLGTILRLYDHILIEEYSPYGESLISNTDSGRRGSSSRTRDITPSSDTESIQLAEDFHACDFCGADIFQSYFQCIGKASSRDGVEGYIVCPGCYVEGRTCACQEMAQMQRQSFDVLLAARWEALEVLKDTGHSMRPFKGFESPRDQKSYFSRTSGSSVFHAAMLLHQIRVNQVCKDIRLSRSCRMAGDSHPVPADWALNCKKCHAAKCFPHLLEGFRMHSMRALLLQEQDTSHILYHSRHIERFSEYDDSKEALLVAQEEGEVYPDFNVHMVYQSLTFQICQPVNNTHASLGWYDRLPPKPKNKRSTEADTERSDTPHSSTSGSQRSVKNHAYVELKPRAVGSNQLSSSPLSSASDELIFVGFLLMLSYIPETVFLGGQVPTQGRFTFSPSVDNDRKPDCNTGEKQGVYIGPSPTLGQEATRLSPRSQS
ncbi:hypothetical protein P691DRAFT_656001 [Macrolepiota fuliginosa MF-IS2]|uniref:JmjC domain-containing protein n=1 Tax=Macrolepiota fuliginosa MF-IS2 TaxID=1400762 RepID=A0A9P5XPR4_9AGAR|nr:hypothetical protein P691DRAFT_656001 [Macrolepiota fuliginosa MF-IS2]